MILEAESCSPTSQRHFPATSLEQSFFSLSAGTAPCGEAAGWAHGSSTQAWLQLWSPTSWMSAHHHRNAPLQSFPFSCYFGGKRNMLQWFHEQIKPMKPLMSQRNYFSTCPLHLEYYLNTCPWTYVQQLLRGHFSSAEVCLMHSNYDLKRTSSECLFCVSGVAPCSEWPPAAAGCPVQSHLHMCSKKVIIL